MAISVADVPKGGLELLGQIVPHLLMARPSSNRVLGGAAPKTSPALTVYTLGLNDAAKVDALVSVKFIGWRYLIDDNGTPAVAEIRPTKDGAPRFSRLTRGPVAEGLQKAAEAATAAYGASGEAYQARILEVPALHAISLWLHGRDDVFFPYLGQDGQVPDTIRQDDQYVSELSVDARRKQAMPVATP